MLTLKNISYIHQNNDVLFTNINLNLNSHEKLALVGNNGSGKSTLLKIIVNELQTTSGSISYSYEPYYIPQIYGQFDHLTIAEAIKVDKKINALHAIMNGETNEVNYNNLADDWTIEERCDAAFDYWDLKNINVNKKLSFLSGGEKTKVFLSGIIIHQPKLILLDEPSNHLDYKTRELLYDFIQETNASIILVSHDRKLLNNLNKICELNSNGIKIYSGNYDSYKQQKEIEKNALNLDIHSKEKELQTARNKEKETIQRQLKLDARGKVKQIKSGMPKVMLNKMKNDAENSTSKLKNTHVEKVTNISQSLQELRSKLSGNDTMKINFDNSNLHNGKSLLIGTDINYAFENKLLWNENINFHIRTPERIALIGKNGSGKTTLINLMLGKIIPRVGSIKKSTNETIYIDQDYSMIDNKLTVQEQAQKFNLTSLLEHEINIRLNRFLFTKDNWTKSCKDLSGGEKMRLLLCCLNIYNKSPDIIILDEPTNNLDIQNIELLTKAINEYKGTLIVVSHDEAFLEEINIERRIELYN